MCVKALSSMNQSPVWQERASLSRRFPNFKLIFSHQREKLKLEKISGWKYFLFLSSQMFKMSKSRTVVILYFSIDIFVQIFLRQELLNKFTFCSGQTAHRQRRVAERLALPTFVPPMFEMKVGWALQCNGNGNIQWYIFQVSTVRYTGTVKIPFVATLSSGNKTW